MEKLIQNSNTKAKAKIPGQKPWDFLFFYSSNKNNSIISNPLVSVSDLLLPENEL